MSQRFIVTLTGILGRGAQGCAHRTADGEVLKITRSRREVIICHRLRALQRAGHEFWRLPMIFGIARMPPRNGAPRYAILRQDVPDADAGPLHAVRNFARAWEDADEEGIGLCIAEEPDLFGLYADLQEFLDLTGIRVGDVGSVGNVGAGMTLRDLGSGSGVRNEDVDAIGWDTIRTRRAPTFA